MASTSRQAAHRSAAPGGSEQPVVIVVDDEEGIRSALRRLFMLAGLASEHYASGAELFERAKFDRPGCIVLDVSMPGMGGLEVQVGLKQRHVNLPVIFLTGRSDIPTAVAAMREGAVDFVEKPFDNDDLLARVRRAVDQHLQSRQGEWQRRQISERLQLLTPRERSVLELIVQGKTNKEIARVLGSSYRTIEVHRGHIMEKLEADSLADLVRMSLLDTRDEPAAAAGET
jgi:two-component system response regulator FixJ